MVEEAVLEENNRDINMEYLLEQNQEKLVILMLLMLHFQLQYYLH